MRIEEEERKRKRKVRWIGIGAIMGIVTVLLLLHQSNSEKEQKIHTAQLARPADLPQLTTGKLTKAEEWSVMRGIRLAREYQIKLNETAFLTRDASIQLYLTALNSLLGTSLTMEQQEVEIRKVSLYLAHLTCFTPRFQLRKRKYVTGKRQGTASIDLKFGVEFPPPYKDKDIFSLPFSPSPSFPNALQKYEIDVHPCKLKISRESRIYDLPTDYIFANCEQVNELFPYVPINETAKERGVPIMHDDAIWYVVDFPIKNYSMPASKYAFGITMPPVDLEIQFQIGVYHSMEEAERGGVFVGRSSEFSLRVWSPSDGFDPLSPPSLSFFDSVYHHLLLQFSSHELPCP